MSIEHTVGLYDPHRSARLIADALRALRPPEYEDRQQPDQLQQLVADLKQEGHPIHHQPQELLAASLLLSDHKLHDRAAEAVLEALEQVPMDNYEDLYEFAHAELEAELALTETKNDDGSIRVEAILHSARCAAQIAILPLHKYIKQTAASNPETIMKLGIAAQEAVIDIIQKLTESEPNNQETSGLANELAILACLLSDSVLKQGLICTPAHRWEDNGFNYGTNTFGLKELKGLDLKIYEPRNETPRKLQVKSNDGGHKIYVQDVTIITANKLLNKNVRAKHYIAPKVKNLWEIFTSDERPSADLLNDLGLTILELSTTPQQHHIANFLSRFRGAEALLEQAS